jgi:hypothetical protein
MMADLLIACRIGALLFIPGTLGVGYCLDLWDGGGDGMLIPPFTPFRMGHPRLFFLRSVGGGCFGLLSGFLFGLSLTHELDFAEEDGSQAGAFSFLDFFRVGGLFFWAD